MIWNGLEKQRAENMVENSTALPCHVCFFNGRTFYPLYSLGRVRALKGSTRFSPGPRLITFGIAEWISTPALRSFSTNVYNCV